MGSKTETEVKSDDHKIILDKPLTKSGYNINTTQRY